MATNRKQVSYGSSGDDVLQLQKALNSNGYNLAEDGVFGANTKAAVEDYQSKNGLDVDGIAGVNTWGALDSASPTTPNTPSGTSTPAPSSTSQGGNYAPYVESDSVKQAQAMLNQQLSSKPGAYQSTWEGQLSDTIAKILNRESFSYDLNGDALYQQYKDRYIQQGQMAMMDTMGQAAAMTGGYGNSYAQMAGQQAYQGYLQQLNDVVPELYGAAYDRYQQEGQDLYNQYAMLGAQEEQEYARYQDELSAYYAELDRRQNQYNTERDYDYSKYIDDRNFAYQQDRDAVADSQWDKSFAYQQGRDAVADKQWQKEYAESIRQYTEQMDYQREQDAYSRSMDLIARGVMPSEDELAKAGIDSKTADTIVKMASGSNFSGLSSTEWDNINDLAERAAGGAENKEQFGNYISYLVNSGLLSEDEAAILFLSYFPDFQPESNVFDTTVDPTNPLYGVDMDAVKDAKYNKTTAELYNEKKPTALSSLGNTSVEKKITPKGGIKLKRNYLN